MERETKVAASPGAEACISMREEEEEWEEEEEEEEG